MAPGKTPQLFAVPEAFSNYADLKWWQHYGDMIVLKGQEKIFLSKSKDGEDRFVLAFRNWLRRHGNSQPEWFGAVGDHQILPSITSKRQMLDRFEQHTLKCSSCSFYLPDMVEVLDRCCYFLAADSRDSSRYADSDSLGAGLTYA